MQFDLPERRMRLSRRAASAAFGASLLLGLSAGGPLRADESPQATKIAPADAKPAEGSKGETPASGATQAESKPVSAAAQLEFQQAKVSAEMTELEQRMFRLSETLKPLEPENASRLMLGVKFAREELIVYQMKQIQEQMRAASLAESVIEQKQLLSKLERLEQLLLSADLDFQMRLERLRQIREVLRRLDSVIREEDRERKLSEQAALKASRAEEAEKRAAGIQQLIERQMAHIDELESLAPDPGAGKPAADSPRARLIAEQSKTRAATAELTPAEQQPRAEELSPSTKPLLEAQRQMLSAEERLAGEKSEPANPPMQAALAALRKALDESRSEAEKLRAELVAERFAAMAKDQSGNRRSTESISEMVRGLGSSGSGALGELVKAGGSMSKAEADLAAREAAPAGEQQQQALAALKYAREQLAAEAERLQEQLRAEVKKRTVEGLLLMLEQQVMVREATQSLSKRASQGSRQAQASVVGLSKSEGKIIALADELITLVEETEFGIALPAALRVVRDEMERVQTALARSEAGEDVIADEERIEADLQSLLDAMKQMPAAGKGDGGKNGNRQDQERELNRLIAELKMVRLLETRVHQDTADTDRERSDAPAVSAKLRRQIDALSGRQEDIRDVTERLATERDLNQP